ncbi:hypothetical protein CRG98_013195 [Punica granatum]|uniref:Uncharacterized protein n=1 Tax=Punica granatum TaxID=22663 RepID=A0A2I0KDZ0_PUNGR|nr:hypothetical protein CRG98_013195 [Punica granatum]
MAILKIEGGGRGRQSATPNPPPRAPASTEDAGYPDPSTEGVGILCRCQRPQWKGQGRQLAASTPNRPRTLEDASTHRGRQRHQWRVRGSRLVAPTPSFFDFSLLN